MLSQKLQDALNDHINKELYSSYLYLSMAAYCESLNLAGFASWMKYQSQEETVHAMKMFDYVHDRDGRVLLQAIDQPPLEFTSVQDVFEKTYEHEQKVTQAINVLYGQAKQENDYAAEAFLQWFVAEQVEEEKSAKAIVDQLRMVGDSPTGLLMLDRALGSRQG